MELNDPIKMHRETIEISGERKLYSYTFDIDEADQEEAKGGNLNEEAQAKG
jgi:hypothetical protein